MAIWQEKLEHVPKIDGRLKKGHAELYNRMMEADRAGVQFSKKEIMGVYVEFVKSAKKKHAYRERPLQTQEQVYDNCMGWFERAIVSLIKNGYLGLQFQKGIINGNGIPPLKKLGVKEILDCNCKSSSPLANFVALGLTIDIFLYADVIIFSAVISAMMCGS